MTLLFRVMSSQVQEQKQGSNSIIFLLDIGFNQSNKTALLCGPKYFWRQLQKRSSKNILWNGCIIEINKLPVNATTLKTNINLDVLDLIIIQSHLEGCFCESSCCSRKTNTTHSIRNYGPGWNEKINKTRK